MKRSLYLDLSQPLPQASPHRSPRRSEHRIVLALGESSPKFSPMVQNTRVPERRKAILREPAPLLRHEQKTDFPRPPRSRFLTPLWQPGCLDKTRGFPSPPRDGFGPLHAFNPTCLAEQCNRFLRISNQIPAQRELRAARVGASPWSKWPCCADRGTTDNVCVRCRSPAPIGSDPATPPGS